MQPAHQARELAEAALWPRPTGREDFAFEHDLGIGDELHVDGLAGRERESFVLTDADTPAKFFPLTRPQPESFFAHWTKLPDEGPHVNPYRAGWEAFIRHVAEGAPFASPFIEGAKDVQLAEASYRSDRERRWIELPRLA